MDIEHKAILRLQEASKMSLQIYGKPLIVTTSGGKDSSVCVELAQRAGIPFEVMHNHTTADAPETVYFVRSEFKRLEAGGVKCTINKPVYKGEPTSMWKLIPQKLMPPTRLVRYCCDVLKESSGRGRFVVTGVRWAESQKRKSRGKFEIIGSKPGRKIVLNNDNDENRQLFETCNPKAKRVCNPIIDWTDGEVWAFLRDSGLPVNPLYSCGYSRVGCVGCPLASKKRYAEFIKWPKYQTMYTNAFSRMLDERKKRGLQTEWKTGEEVFHWWMKDGMLPGQVKFDDFENEQTDIEEMET